MANFFSSAPIDLGAQYKYQGYADMGRGIANGINGAVSQVYDARNAAKRQEVAGQQALDQIDLNGSVRSQQRKMELDQQTLADALSYKVEPVYDASGQLNRMATDAKVFEAKEVHQRIKTEAERKATYEFNLGNEAKKYGVTAPGGQQPIPTSGPMSLGSFEAPKPAEPFNANTLPLEAQIEAAKRKNTLSTAQTNKSRGAFTVNGQYIGDGVFNEITGQTGIMKDGKFSPLPAGAEPMTSTGLHKAVPDINSFKKMKQDLTSSKVALKAMDRYAESVGGSAQGFSLIADKFSTGFKTLFETGALSEGELAQASSQGQLQGLLGKFRSSILSPGVLTEPDAERIILALGGDVDGLRNPEVVKQALGKIYSDRYQQYQDDRLFHNAAVGEYYGSKGFKEEPEVQFSSNFLNDYESMRAQPGQGAPVASQAQPAPGAAAAPAVPITPQQAKAELLRRRGGR